MDNLDLIPEFAVFSYIGNNNLIKINTLIVPYWRSLYSILRTKKYKHVKNVHCILGLNEHYHNIVEKLCSHLVQIYKIYRVLKEYDVKLVLYGLKNKMRPYKRSLELKDLLKSYLLLGLLGNNTQRNKEK